MPHCPQCHSEYRQGFEWCPDCKTAVVEAPAPEAASHPEGDPSTPKGEALVTVGTFANPTMAALLATQLDAEGIETFMDDAETLSMDPLWANALGGVKVRVRVSDAEAAREIAGRPREKSAEDPGEPVVPCPRCKSPRTLRETFSSRLAFLSILLVGFPWPFRKKGRRRCVACGHAWQDNPPDPSISKPQA
jgi:hypothetical protein